MYKVAFCYTDRSWNLSSILCQKAISRATIIPNVHANMNLNCRKENRREENLYIVREQTSKGSVSQYLGSGLSVHNFVFLIQLFSPLWERVATGILEEGWI